MTLQVTCGSSSSSGDLKVPSVRVCCGMTAATVEVRVQEQERTGGGRSELVGVGVTLREGPGRSPGGPVRACNQPYG